MDEKKLGSQLADNELDNVVGGAAEVITASVDSCSHPNTTLSDLMAGNCSFFTVKNPSNNTVGCVNCQYYSGGATVTATQY